MTERASIEAAVAMTIETYGAVNVLFNDAGGASPDRFPEPGGDEAWEKMLRLNLNQHVYVDPGLLAASGGRGRGSIINMSSGAAVVAISGEQQGLVPGIPAASYWAAKAGVEAFTRYVASVGAPHGIRANAIRPGQIVTPLVQRFTPGHHYLERYFQQIQLTRGPGQPEDVANTVLFLASDESRFINAQMLNIDGGAAGKV